MFFCFFFSIDSTSKLVPIGWTDANWKGSAAKLNAPSIHTTSWPNVIILFLLCKIISSSFLLFKNQKQKQKHMAQIARAWQMAQYSYSF